MFLVFLITFLSWYSLTFTKAGPGPIFSPVVAISLTNSLEYSLNFPLKIVLRVCFDMNGTSDELIDLVLMLVVP